MKTIREIALEVAGDFLLDAAGKQNVQAFAESVLAAYLAQQEPIAWMHGDYLYHALSHDEQFLRKEASPLYLAPPIKRGFVIVPVSTLQHWRTLVDDNPRDLAPRIDAYITASQEKQK